MRKMNLYLLGARLLMVVGGLALLGGTRALGVAGVLIGLGLVVELLWRILEENRDFKALLLVAMRGAKDGGDGKDQGGKAGEAS